MNRQKEPLYRKHNKLATHFHLSRSSAGGNFRHQRNTKEMTTFEGSHMPVKSSQIGYDYTPLYKFLLSRVGKNWDEVFSEAVSRLNEQEPIFRMVDLRYEDKDFKHPIARLGESTYYSRLTVKDGILVKADPNAKAPDKYCTCCTHSFNGVPY